MEEVGGNHLSKKRNAGVGKSCSRRKVLLLSSSNGRGCSTVIQEKLGNNYEVSGVVKPNARLVNVVEDIDALTKNFNKNDCVVVLGGTNDLDCYNSNYKEKFSSSLKKAQAVSLRTNVIFNSIPNRFDDQVLDVERVKANKEFHNLLNGQDERNKENINVFYKTAAMERKYFTTHGLHFNKLGKEFLRESWVRIIKAFEGKLNNSSEAPTIQKTKPTFLEVCLGAKEKK